MMVSSGWRRYVGITNDFVLWTRGKARPVSFADKAEIIKTRQLSLVSLYDMSFLLILLLSNNALCLRHAEHNDIRAERLTQGLH